MSDGAAAPTLLALDFDGVVCDSAGESALATWHAFGTVWPGHPETPPEGFVEAYRRLRPVIETGWENFVLARLIVDGVDEADVLARFRSHWCPDVIDRHGLGGEDLVERFGRVRDAWRARDPAAWLECQPLFPGLRDMLRGHLERDRLVYVITTKQTRFAQAILAHHGVVLPEGRLLGLESGPKTDSLERLARAHGLAPADVWFVEDRLETLERAAGVAALEGIGLFLVDWGYNTAAERARVAADPRIEIIDLARFVGPFAGWRAAAAA